MSKPTHIVKHPKLHMMAGGKLRHVPAGTPVILSEAVAKGLGKKVQSIKEVEALKIGEAEGKEASKAALKKTAELKKLGEAVEQAVAAVEEAKKAGKSDADITKLKKIADDAADALVKASQ